MSASPLDSLDAWAALRDAQEAFARAVATGAADAPELRAAVLDAIGALRGGIAALRSADPAATDPTCSRFYATNAAELALEVAEYALDEDLRALVSARLMQEQLVEAQSRSQLEAYLEQTAPAGSA